jgi:hypothetical protein
MVRFLFFCHITICVVKGLQRTATIGDHKQEHIFDTSFDQLVDTTEKQMRFCLS